MKRYTVQHRDTNNTWSDNQVTTLHKATRSHREREKVLDGLPARDHCGGSDPETRGGKVSGGLATFPPARGAPAAKNRGSLPPLAPPPVWRHDAPCEAGTRGAGAALCFTAEDSGNPCQPASNEGFRAQPGPRRRGLRPLREERWSGQKREPLGEPPV